MSFTLRLHISGLGLFTEHMENEKPQLHVLLPDSTGHAQHPRHFAKIYFEDKYNASSTVRSPVAVDGLRWTLPESSSPTLTPPPSGVLLDVSKLPQIEWKLPRGQTQHQYQMHVSSHVVISDGAYACHGAQAEFQIEPGGAQRTMTNRIVWEIPNISGTGLRLNLEKLRQHPSSPVPTVDLKPDANVIELHLLYAPQNEHQGNPGPARCADAPHTHFGMYRVLFGAGVQATARCVTDAILGCEEPELPVMKNQHQKGTRIYTCMLAQADVEPSTTTAGEPESQSPTP